MLIKVIRLHESLRVGDRTLTLVHMPSRSCGIFELDDGELVDVGSLGKVEILPDVWMHAHNKGMLTADRFRVAIDAPQHIKIGDA